MKHLLILFLFLSVASICHATSNISFSGGGYEISVLLCDEDCKVVGLNIGGDNPNIISIGANELTAFSKTESDCKKKTIHLVGAGDEIASPFRIEKHHQERPHDTWGEESKRIT
jgi:hypothetical protein